MILLENRAVIRVGGEDAADYLQGLITNDINQLSPEDAVYTALLTPQGKYLFDFFIYQEKGGFTIDCEAKRKDDLVKRLNMYKLRAKVEVEDLPEWKVYSDGKLGCFDHRSKKLDFRFTSPKEMETDGGFEDYEDLRLSLGIPDSADFIPEKSYISHYRFEELNGVDFKKGCYVGQEVVARAKYTGTIRKTIYKISGDCLPEFGSDILAEGKKIGTMLTSQDDKGLALLDIELAGNISEYKVEEPSYI